MKTGIFSLAMLSGLTVLSADTYWLNTAPADSKGAFSDISCWVDENGGAAAWNSSASYKVSNTSPSSATSIARVLYGPQSAATFQGGQIEFSSLDKSREQSFYSRCTDPEGVDVPGGIILSDYSRIDCAGGVTSYLNSNLKTTKKEVGSLPIVRPDGDNATVIFRGRVSGEYGSQSWMRFDTRDSNPKKNFTVKLLGDLSGYTGVFEMLNRISEATFISDPRVFNIKFVFSSGTCPATFYAHNSNNSVTNFCANIYAVNACSDVFRLKQFGLLHDSKSYSIQNGMSFEFPVDGQNGQCGEFRIYDRLQDGYEAASNVVIRLMGDPRGSVVNKFATLSVPAATPLDVNKLKLEIAPTPAVPVDAKLTVEERTAEDGILYSTVYVTVNPVRGPLVTLDTTDSTSHGGGATTSALLDAPERWSSKELPTAGFEYLVDGRSALKALRTPCTNAIEKSGEYTSFPEVYAFPDAALILWGQARIQTAARDVTFDDLRGYDLTGYAGLYKILKAPAVTTVRGKINIASGTFNFGCFHDQVLVVESELSGPGTVAYSGMFIADDARATYCPTATNDAFFGKVVLCQTYRDSGCLPTWTDDYPILCLREGVNLGGNLAVPTSDALTIKDYGRLRTAQSFTIAKDSNRGVTVKGTGIFLADQGMNMTIETPLVVDGTAWKDGPGTLTLAGTACGVESANELIVTNGVLSLGSVDAVKGLAVKFAVGTKLAIRPNLEDADFVSKGVDLTTAGTSLVPAGSAFAMTNDPDWQTRELPGTAARFALFTVPTAQASAFKAKLPGVPPRFFNGTKSVWTEPVVDVEAQTTTFGIEASKHGVLLIVR